MGHFWHFWLFFSVTLYNLSLKFGMLSGLFSYSLNSIPQSWFQWPFLHVDSGTCMSISGYTLSSVSSIQLLFQFSGGHIRHCKVIITKVWFINFPATPLTHVYVQYFPAQRLTTLSIKLCWFCLLISFTTDRPVNHLILLILVEYLLNSSVFLLHYATQIRLSLGSLWLLKSLSNNLWFFN